MVRFFSRLFNVKVDEWPRLLILYSMAFLFIVGITWGELSVEASFLTKVGVKSLPQVLIVNAVVSIIAIAAYTPFVDRLANDRLLIVITVISASSIGIGRLLLGMGLTSTAYTLLYLLALVIAQTFRLHWWTYVNGFYDTRSAKRIVPVLFTASRVAVIFAGQTIPFLNAYFASGDIIWMWICTLVIVALLAWIMPDLLSDWQSIESEQESSLASVDSQRTSFIRNIREGYRYVSRSPYLRWMALSTLLLMLLITALTYRTSQIFVSPEHFTDAKALSSFLGDLNSWASLILLPFQLFLLSRIVGRMGLGNANLIFPVTTIAICGSLVAWPGLATAALGYLDRKVFYTVLRNPTDNLLYNAVPLRVKGRARAFIGGLIAPLGSLAGGCLLLMLPLIPMRWFLPALIGVSAAAYVMSALVVRRQYTQALISMLEQEDFSFLLSQPSDLTVTDTATLNWLTRRLEESTSSDFTIFVANLISEAGGNEAVPILGRIAETGNAYVRSTIIDILVAAGMQGEAVGRLYTQFLTDPDGGVRRSAVAGLEQWAGPESEEFLEQALELLSDPETDVRAQVIPPLVRSGDFFYLASAIQSLSEIMADADPHRRAQGVRILGQVGNARFIRNLVNYLDDPDDQVRLEAAVAIEALSQDTMPRRIKTMTMEHVRPLLDDPVERVRLAAVNILGRIGMSEAHRLLLDLMTDPSPQVRETTVNTLTQIGKEIIPLLSAALNDADPQKRQMATVTLSRIDREQFGPLIESHIDDNLRTIYRNYGHLQALLPYMDRPSISVLHSTLARQNRQLTEEIFYLLSAIHDPEALQVIAESLKSETARVRANAVEALESLTTPQMAGLIAPLSDPDLPPAHVLQIGRDHWDILLPDTTETIRQLAADPDPWLRALMTFALGEIGSTLAPQELETMLEDALTDPTAEVQAAAHAAKRAVASLHTADVAQEEETMLSTVEKVIFLKEVPFFAGMTIDQLKVLAGICEEEFFPEGTQVFAEGDPGGALYVVVNGRVAIEREGQREGSVVHLETIESRSYFGEMSLFGDSLRSAAAVAVRDTLTLRLRREPLIALIRQHPNLSLELINTLSQRLRDANDRIVQLTRAKPRELERLYDKLD